MRAKGLSDGENIRSGVVVGDGVGEDGGMMDPAGTGEGRESAGMARGSESPSMRKMRTAAAWTLIVLGLLVVVATRSVPGSVIGLGLIGVGWAVAKGGVGCG